MTLILDPKKTLDAKIISALKTLDAYQFVAWLSERQDQIAETSEGRLFVDAVNHMPEVYVFLGWDRRKLDDRQNIDMLYDMSRAELLSDDLGGEV
jgi:hypothetical protein